MAITLKAVSKGLNHVDLDVGMVPTPGDLWVIWCTLSPGQVPGFTDIAGPMQAGLSLTTTMFVRQCETGDTGIVTVPAPTHFIAALFGGVSEVPIVTETLDDQGTGNSGLPQALNIPITVPAGEHLVLACFEHDNAPGFATTIDSGWTNLERLDPHGTKFMQAIYKVGTDLGAQNPGIDTTQNGFWYGFAFAFPDETPTEPPPPIVIEIEGVVLENAYDKKIKIQLNDVGSGEFTIHKSDPQATDSNLKEGNLVSVILPYVSASPIFSFFIESREARPISGDEEGGEEIKIAGRGALSYWDRAIWLSSSFTVPWWPPELPTPDPSRTGAVRVKAGTYRLYNVVGGVIDGTDTAGSGFTLFTTTGFSAFYVNRRTYKWPDEDSKRILARLLVSDGVGDLPPDGSYFHPLQGGVTDFRRRYEIADGIDLSEIGDGDKPGQVLKFMFDEGTSGSRPVAPIAGMTIDFDETDDSASNSWNTTEALKGLTVSVHETYLETIQKLVTTGVIDVVMHPDLDFQAFNSYGRDLTGGSFGAGTVRFEKGVNIATELERGFRNGSPYTFAEVQGTEGTYVAVEAPLAGYDDREIGLRANSNDETALADYGARMLEYLNERQDGAVFSIATGDDVDAGYYIPGPEGTNGHFWVGDTIRLHTGTGTEDYDEQDYRVLAITIQESEAASPMDPGEYIVDVEVGSFIDEVPTPPHAPEKLPGAEGGNDPPPPNQQEPHTGTHRHADLTAVTANQHHNEDHNTRHTAAGDDPVKLDDLATPDDNTDLNASTTRHGLLRKLSGTATQYLDGDGQWTTPAGSSHPNLATHDGLGLATDAELAAHAATAHGDPADDTHAWMPLTTVVGGEPELVWDADDSLIPTLTPV